jgi:hypothetical protein
VRSTILTSQLPVARWHEQIGDPTLADAILDRLVHNAWGSPHALSRTPFSAAASILRSAPDRFLLTKPNTLPHNRVASVATL